MAVSPLLVLLLIVSIFFIVPTLCTTEKQCSPMQCEIMNNRFLKVGDGNADRVYAVQSSNVATWQDCLDECCSVTECEFVSFQVDSFSNNCYMINCRGNLDYCMTSVTHRRGFMSTAMQLPEEPEPAVSTNTVSGDVVKTPTGAASGPIESAGLTNTTTITNTINSTKNFATSYSSSTSDTDSTPPTRSPYDYNDSPSPEEPVDPFVFIDEPILCSGIRTSMGCFSKIWIGVIGTLIAVVVAVSAVVLFFVVRRRREAARQQEEKMMKKKKKKDRRRR